MLPSNTGEVSVFMNQSTGCDVISNENVFSLHSLALSTNSLSKSRATICFSRLAIRTVGNKNGFKYKTQKPLHTDNFALQGDPWWPNESFQAR